MKKNLRYLPAFIALTLISCLGANTSYGQPWTYDFGTATGNFDTANRSSTTFLSTYIAPTPAGGGTFRLRTATAGNSGTGDIVANPGTTLGTGSELQINAAITSVLNKLTVYGWTNPALVAYLKCKFRTTSSDTGVIAFAMGDGVSTVYSGNDTYTAYATTMVSFTIAYKNGVLTTVARRNANANTAITGHGFLKDADQVLEIYANNASTATAYMRNGTNNLASQTWDMWVDGVKISPDGGWAKAQASLTSFIAADVPLAGYGFFSHLSHTNEAFTYIDDLEYSNSLSPSTMPLSLLSFNGVLKGNEAMLKWETTNEVNVYGYSIEKSMANNSYEEIGFVAASNQQSNHYNFTDVHLKPGANLYRVKMIDKDGAFKYSSVIKLSGRQGSLQLYPNPVTGPVILVNHDKATTASYLKLTTAEGRTIKTIRVNEGFLQTNMNVAGLAKGNYILVFENNASKTVTRFTKQ